MEEPTARPAVSAKRRRFDVAFGVVLPLICLVVDPVVFRTWWDFSPPLFAHFRLFGYVVILLGVACAAGALVRPRSSAVLAGVLLGGACVAGALGLFLLPLAVLGTFLLGLGLLGLTPLGTAWVLVRHGRATLALGVPSIAQLAVNRTIARDTQLVLAGTPAEVEQATRRLRVLQYASTLDFLVLAWGELESPARKSAVADTYLALTGEDIESRLLVLWD